MVSREGESDDNCISGMQHLSLVVDGLPMHVCGNYTLEAAFWDYGKCVR